MRLYIMRHGETDWNKARRLQGQADIPLNEVGRSIARQTAAGMKDITLDAVYSSPLIRAKETAQIVIGKREVPLLEDDRLREMSFGPYEGLCCAADNWEIPDPEFENFFHAPDRYIPPEGGDAFTDVLKRVSDFTAELSGNARYSGSNILIVCHGVVVGSFLSIIKKRTIAGFWDDKVQKNCAVNVVDVLDADLQLAAEGVIYYDDKVKDW